MLIQLPSGSPDQPGPQNAEQTNTTFEAGLRRDLASSPIVSYDTMLGGVSKRSVDLCLTLISAPLWLLAMFGVAGWSKLRHRAPVFLKQERIGYGGRAFMCFSLRTAPPPTATIEQLHPAPEDVAANEAKAAAPKTNLGRAKWQRALERLPQLLNVIRGEMALIGPLPLPREELEPMKSARRYYLSARPGVVGVNTIIGGVNDPSQYKIYAMSWAITTDALILWDAIRTLRERDELWKPSFTRAKPGQSTSGVVVRRRNAS